MFIIDAHYNKFNVNYRIKCFVPINNVSIVLSLSVKPAELRVIVTSFISCDRREVK